MTIETTSPRYERVLAIDIGRGASVLLMIMVHTMWLYGSVDAQRSGFGVALQVVGQGTAMFLVAMGFSFMLARDQSASGSARRGLYLLAAGYAMNFLKFVVPSTVGFVPDAFIRAYGWTPPATNEQLLYMLLTGDILQLAGVSLIFMGLIRRWSANTPAALLLWATLVAAGTHLVRGTRVGIVGIDHVLDLLWGVEWNVYFPVFPWFSTILVGMFLGARYRELADPERVFREIFVAGLLATGFGLALVLIWPETHFIDFFHLGFGGIVYLIGINLLLMRFAHFLAMWREPGSLRALILYSSERVTSLYVISWVVICWGMGIVGYQSLDGWGVLVAIAVVGGVTFGIRRVLDRLEGHR